MISTDRMAWIDHARALCIILVVMMHSTLGVENAMGAEGWLHGLVAFSQPFRIPAFFLLAGLFAHKIDGWSWRRFWDRRVLYYVYFYVLWVTIQFAFKAPGIALSDGVGQAVSDYLMAFVQPFGTLWFIYVLPLFFLVMRLATPLPIWLVFTATLILHLAPINTGWVALDDFADNLVFFAAGHLFHRQIFAFGAGAAANPLPVLVGLAVWAPLNAVTAQMDVPGLGTLMSLIGAAALISIAVLFDRLAHASWASDGLGWIGRNTIVIYLAFFLPMAVTRTAITATGLITDVGLASLIVTIAALSGPIVLYWLIHWTGWGRFLFTRPWVLIYERRARDRQTVPAE